MSDKNKIDIIPDTKIADLLEHYPGLEKVLIKMTPAFSKLKNPVLRKTIAKVTSLKQAAKIGNIKPANMINKLRKEAGLPDREISENHNRSENKPKPDWVIKEKVKITFDARQIIDAGESPMRKILDKLKQLHDNDLMILITSFIPQPIIDIAQKNGFEAWSRMESGDIVETFFRAGAKLYR